MAGPRGGAVITRASYRVGLIWVMALALVAT